MNDEENILQQQPTAMPDINCGEGWLCRTAPFHGIKTLGIDAIAELITCTKAQGHGNFDVIPYQDSLCSTCWNW